MNSGRPETSNFVGDDRRELIGPLSAAQQRLWFLSQYDTTTSAYNLCVAVRLRGQLDIERLESALYLVVQRHEALRTLFDSKSGSPFQRVIPTASTRLGFLDLSALGQNEALVERELRRLAAAPFDLSREVIRLTLVRLGQDHHVVVVALHHLCADGWSAALFVADFEHAYRQGQIDTPPPVLTPIRFAISEQQALLTQRDGEERQFWREHLRGAPPESRVPGTTVPLHEREWEGARIPLSISQSKLNQIHELTSTVGGRPFAFLVAVTQLLVSRLAAQNDVVIAAPMANRRQPDTQLVIGMFVNTVPLRATFTPQTTFREHLQHTAAVVEQAKRYQHFPFARILEEVDIPRDAGQQPLCQVMVNYLGVLMPPAQMEGLQTEVIGQIDTGAAQYDLAIHLETSAGQGLRGWIEYRTSRYDPDWASRIVKRLHTLIDSSLAQPDTPATELNLLADTEREQLLAFDTVTGPDHGSKRLHDFILEQAQRTPNRVAVRDDEHRELTYAELIAQARVLAGELRTLGVGPDVVVGVCGDRSVRLMTALVGVLLAGGAYLPLDPQHPTRRLATILTEARPKAILADKPYTERLPATDVGAQLLPLNGTGAHHDPTDPGDSGLGSAHDLAYVIYTSGSTGRPKGVAITHRGIVNRLAWMQSRYQLQPDDVVLQKTPITFDVSVWELFWPLMVGASVVMARPDGHKDPVYLAEVIRKAAVTTLHFVPSMLAAFVDEPDVSRCTSLRRVICSGEALPAHLVARLRSSSGAEIHNLYGPTEASVDVSHWACREHEPAPVVPIGRPIANTTLRVLDAVGRPAPIGSPGELHIGGIQLARGYLGRPDLTEERFPQTQHGRLYRTGDLARWTPDGYLEFLGRIDHQVKLRGLRIELGEIEAVLREHPGVSEAVVVLRDDSPSPQLVSYVVASEDIDTEQVRQFLIERLPEHMVPARLVVLEALPLTTSGKLDRKALPQPEPRKSTPSDNSPLSPLASTLREIWAEVLGTNTDALGASDNFFDQGGDSLQSIKVRALLRERGLDIEVADMFRSPRLAAMATKIHPRTNAIQDLDPLPRPAALPNGVIDAYPLSALQAGMIFHSEFAPEAAVYQVSFVLHLRMPFDHNTFQESVNTLIARHDILRTRFEFATEDGPLQYVQEKAALSVPVDDLRDLPLTEAQQRVQDLFEAEQRQPFDLKKPPLLRLAVLRRTNEILDLTVSFHDSIFDGWSAAVFLTELFSIYLNALNDTVENTPKLASRYRDFIIEERAAQTNSDARQFWAAQLKDAVFLRLPRRSGSNGGDGLSIDVPVEVPAELFSHVKTAASQLQIPVKSVLLGAYIATLARTGGISDVLTGLVSGGRPELLGAERILGQFLNTVPIRVPVIGSWTDFLTRVFETETRILEHRRFPVVELQRTHQGRQLFESAFNYIHFHVYESIKRRRDIEYLGGQFTDPFHFPMTVNARVHPITGELGIVVNYATNELSESHALEFAHLMIDALLSITAAPGTECTEWTGVRGDRHDVEVIQAGTRTRGRRQRTPGEVSTRERELIDIWEGVLGIRGIDVHDDYFELGGDSILSIQICARARQLGHKIRPKDVFDNPSVRLLSARIEQINDKPESFTATRGPLRATPAQLFRLSGAGNADWDNVALVVKLRDPLDQEKFIASVATTLARHEALRTAIQQRPDGSWWQEISDISVTEVIQPQRDQDFDEWLADAHQSLKLAEGRVLRVGQHSGHLALIAHHAISDAVSLQVLLSDLIVAYTTGSSLVDSGVPLAALESSVRSNEQPWRRLLSAGNAQLLPGPPNSNLFADEHVLEGVLDDETTATLIRIAADESVNVLHLVLAATTTALSRQFNRPRIIIDVMTSGRERTQIAEAVGCLAAPVPIAVEAYTTDPALRAHEVKNALDAAIPNQRAYLTLRAEEPHLDYPDVMVNYLGRFTGDFPDPVVDIVPINDGYRAPDRQRPHRLELQSVIIAEHLYLRARYSTAIHKQKYIQAIADHILFELSEIVHGHRQDNSSTQRSRVTTSQN